MTNDTESLFAALHYCGSCDAGHVWDPRVQGNVAPCPNGCPRQVEGSLNERVCLPNGALGVVTATHPTLEGIVLVQPDAPGMAWYSVKELRVEP